MAFVKIFWFYFYIGDLWESFLLTTSLGEKYNFCLKNSKKICNFFNHHCLSQSESFDSVHICQIFLMFLLGVNNICLLITLVRYNFCLILLNKYAQSWPICRMIFRMTMLNSWWQDWRISIWVFLVIHRVGNNGI